MAHNMKQYEREISIHTWGSKPKTKYTKCCKTGRDLSQRMLRSEKKENLLTFGMTQG